MAEQAAARVIDLSGNAPAADSPDGDVSGEIPGATADEMAALMSGAADEPAVPDAPAATPAAAVGDIPAPAAPAAGDPPAAEPAKELDELPAPPAAADAAQLAEDQVKLRKGWAALNRSKEDLLRQKNEAAQAIARAKDWEAKARTLESLPDRMAKAPLDVIFELAGKTTPEDQEAFLTSLLDHVVETEKSPVEREVAHLKRQLADKEEAEKKAAADAAENAKKQNEARVLSEWAQRNTAFASSTPENIEKYDLINSLNQGEAVHQTVLAYHAKYGALLEASVAADHVEKHLEAGIERSKKVKARLAASQPAAPAPTPTKGNGAPAKAAQPSSGTNAPKQPGKSTTTLTSVASGDGTPSAPVFSDDADERYEAVLRQMQQSGELPDEWRVFGPAQSQ